MAAPQHEGGCEMITDMPMITIPREVAREAWCALHIRRQTVIELRRQAAEFQDLADVAHWATREEALTNAMQQLHDAEARS